MSVIGPKAKAIAARSCVLLMSVREFFLSAASLLGADHAVMWADQRRMAAWMHPPIRRPHMAAAGRGQRTTAHATAG